AANAAAFDRRCKLSAGMPDGTSNTIAFAEHYAVRGWYVTFSWNVTFSKLFKNGLILHRASFADSSTGSPGLAPVPPDVYPITEGNPPVATCSVPDLTFQVAPRIEDLDRRLAQTPHSSGMLVGMADGSIHSLAPGIAPSVYWALVTPAGGEIVEVP